MPTQVESRSPEEITAGHKQVALSMAVGEGLTGAKAVEVAEIYLAFLTK